MEGTKLKAVLYDESSALKKWQESHETDLAGVIEAIERIKGFINDYLTNLVTREKVFFSKEQNKNFDNCENDKSCNDIKEEIQDDKIAGLIKGMAAVSEQRNINEKRKSNFFIKVKKLKK